MKHKTSELTGARLDAAVAKAEGKNFGFGAMRGDSAAKVCFIDAPSQRHDQTPDWFSPSTLWSTGGSIIERERIVLVYSYNWTEGKGWHAFDHRYFEHVHGAPDGIGETALIAAMRAFVGLKFGSDVEL